MSSTADEDISAGAVSSLVVAWKAFVTVSVIGPLAMFGLMGMLITLSFGGAAIPSSNQLIREALSPIWPTLLIWFAYSLGVLVWTDRRTTDIKAGLFSGWLLLLLWLIEKSPAALQTFSSSSDPKQITGALLPLYIAGLGLLIPLGIIWRRSKNTNRETKMRQP